MPVKKSSRHHVFKNFSAKPPASHLAHQRGENWGQVLCYKAERAAFKRLLNNFVAVGRFREVSQLGHKGFEVAFEYLNSHGQLYSYIIPTMKTVLSVL